MDFPRLIKSTHLHLPKVLIPIVTVLILSLGIGGIVYRNGYLESSDYRSKISEIDQSLRDNTLWHSRYEKLRDAGGSASDFKKVSMVKLEVLDTQKSIYELQKQQLDPLSLLNFALANELKQQNEQLKQKNDELESEKNSLPEIFRDTDRVAVLLEKRGN